MHLNLQTQQTYIHTTRVLKIVDTIFGQRRLNLAQGYLQSFGDGNDKYKREWDYEY